MAVDESECSGGPGCHGRGVARVLTCERYERVPESLISSEGRSHFLGVGAHTDLFHSPSNLVGQSNDIDDAIVAAGTTAGRELVSGIASENYASVPGPMVDNTLLETHETGLKTVLIDLAQAELSIRKKMHMAPSLDECILIRLGESNALLGGLWQPLIDAHNGCLLSSKELRSATDTVSLSRRAWLQTFRHGRRHADPEALVGGLKWLSIVDGKRSAGKGHIAHLLAHNTVGAIRADDICASVGSVILAVDGDETVRTFGDGGNTLVGEDLLL